MDLGRLPRRATSAEEQEGAGIVGPWAPIERLRQQLNEASNSLEVARTHYVEVRRLYWEAVHGLAQSAPTEQRQQFVSWIYWNSEGELLVKEVAALFGLTLMQLQAILEPVPSGECESCGGQILVSSRTERREVSKGKLRWRTSEGMLLLCHACRANEQTRRMAEWAEDDRLRQEYIELLRTMPYPDYLRTEHWQNVRQAAIRRARGRCQLCYGEAALDVHHRTYERRGEEVASDVIALCRHCHSKHHDKLPEPIIHADEEPTSS